MPEFDVWFESVAREWGAQHHMKITVDTIPVEKIAAAAAAEIAAAKGHDVFIFPWPPAEYYQHAIDHGGIYQLAAAKYGAIPQLAYRSTFNPGNRQLLRVCRLLDADAAAVLSGLLGPGRHALRAFDIQQFARRWARVAREIRHPFGAGIYADPRGQRHPAHSALRAPGLAVGWRWQRALRQERVCRPGAEIHPVALPGVGLARAVDLGPGGQRPAMLARKTSVTSNAISLVRAAEKQDPQVAGKLWVQPPLLGTNGVGVTALPHITNCSVVWNFAHNPAAASQFIADLVDSSRAGYEKSLGCNFPIYPKTVPDLIVRLSKDPRADPSFKYVALKDALHWTPNLGVPGFATPAYMEVFNSFLVPRMVQSVLKGERTPEDAAAGAAAEIQRIVTKWQQV